MRTIVQTTPKRRPVARPPPGGALTQSPLESTISIQKIFFRYQNIIRSFLEWLLNPGNYPRLLFQNNVPLIGLIYQHKGQTDTITLSSIWQRGGRKEGYDLITDRVAELIQLSRVVLIYFALKSRRSDLRRYARKIEKPFRSRPVDIRSLAKQTKPSQMTTHRLLKNLK